jgi:hypothetical protein
MNDVKDKGWLLIFGLILFMVIIGSLVVYSMNGPMNIEERFSHATGLSHNDGDTEGHWFGFSIEGSPFLYVLVLCGLAVVCFALFKYSKF